jgi:hypothetical protein
MVETILPQEASEILFKELARLAPAHGFPLTTDWEQFDDRIKDLWAAAWREVLTKLRNPPQIESIADEYPDTERSDIDQPAPGEWTH